MRIHYFVDGYNLFFRALDDKSSFQEKREQLLAWLQEQALSLNLDLTIVFDGSPETPGEQRRSHIGLLEIVYTGKRLSADSYILEELSRLTRRHNQCVITSDKGLSRQCRHLGADAQTIEAFLKLLNTRRSKQNTQDEKAIEELPFHLERLQKIFEAKLNKHL